MKRGFLPLSLLLIFNILAGTSLLANTPEKGGKYTPRSSEAVTAEAYRASLRANQHTGMVDPADVLKAMQKTDQASTNKEATALNWVNLGPDNYGGQVKAIIFDNRDGSSGTVLAGTNGGGIWKSVNNGITWTRVSQKNMIVSSMVQTSNGDIYVGTGDGFDAQGFSGLNDFNYTTGLIGHGIYKSTDGQNFEQLPATVPVANDNGAAWAFVNELATNASGHIFAATNSGLMFSTDGGSSWTLATDAEANELNMNATDVKVGSDGTILAAVANKCYISKSGNTSGFVNRSTADSVSLPIENVNRLELAIAPSDPNKLYASAVTSFGAHLGIYTSADKGDTWEIILPATNQTNIYSGFGNYNNSITVFPEDPNRILINAALLWEGRRVVEHGLYAWEAKSSISFGDFFDETSMHLGQHRLVFNPTNANQFYVATDGGVFKGAVSGSNFTFENSNRNFITSRFYDIAPTGQENRVVGGSQDNGTIYVSSTGNTTKQGEIIYSPTFPSNGGSSVVSVIDPQAAVVSSTAGIMDRTEDMGFTFSTQFLEPSMSNPQVFNTPITLWESFDNENSRDSITFFAKKNYVAGDVLKVRSNNNSHPFSFVLTNNLANGDSLRIKDVVSSKLFVALANKVWMTKDMLDFGKQPQWFELSNTSVDFSGIPQAMAHSKDANHLFIGTRDGRLFRISNIALAYNYELADINSPLCIVATKQLPIYEPGGTTPISQAITSIAVDPNNPNNVMVTLANYGNDNYIYMTTNALDGAPTFTSKQGNLPQMPVYASILEMTSPEKAMVGTEHGVYITDDINSASPVWTADQGEMGNVPVFDLQQQWINRAADTVQLINIDTVVMNYPGTNNYGIIYAATFGRGLYRCNNFRKPVGIEENPSYTASNELSMSVYPNPITDQATIKFEITENNSVSYQIFDLSGRMIQQQELGIFTQGSYQHTVNFDQLKNGTYILRMQSGQRNKAVKILVY